MEPLLGMPAGWLPRDSAQLDTYMREMLAGGSLVVTDTSRALARALLYPPRWYVAWPAFRAMQLITIGSLPPSIREAYGFAWRPRDERALARWTTHDSNVGAAASANRTRVAGGEARRSGRLTGVSSDAHGALKEELWTCTFTTPHTPIATANSRRSSSLRHTSSRTFPNCARRWPFSTEGPPYGNTRTHCHLPPRPDPRHDRARDGVHRPDGSDRSVGRRNGRQRRPHQHPEPSHHDGHRGQRARAAAARGLRRAARPDGATGSALSPR